MPEAIISGEIFRFGNTLIQGALQLTSDQDYDSREARPGLKPPPQPLVMRRRVGVRVYDAIWDCGGLTIVSPRFLELMRSIGATGWTSYPVDVRGKDDAQIEGYECLVVTGRDPGIELIRPLPDAAWNTIHLGFTPYRRRLPDGRLDPSPERPPAFDFIVPETTSVFCVSGRIRREWDEARLRGIRFDAIGWVQREHIEGEKPKLAK